MVGDEIIPVVIFIVVTGAVVLLLAAAIAGFGAHVG